MAEQLKNSLEDFLKGQLAGDKKKPSLEEVFQKTLDITTPSTPGDVRNLRTVEEKKEENWF